MMGDLDPFFKVTAPDDCRNNENLDLWLVNAITDKVFNEFPRKSHHTCISTTSRTSSMMGDLDPFFKVTAPAD